MKQRYRNRQLLIFCLLIVAFATAIRGQSGGTFSITQSVISSGGTQSVTGGTFALQGTIAQTTVGVDPGGGQFSVLGGFWHPGLAPTSAGVSISGRVVTATNIGIRNARISVIGGSLGEPVIVTTGAMGSYRIDGLRAGDTYIVSVSSHRFVFATPSLIVTLSDSISGVDFVSQE